MYTKPQPKNPRRSPMDEKLPTQKPRTKPSRGGLGLTKPPVVKTKAIRKFADGGSFTTTREVPQLQQPPVGLRKAPGNSAWGRAQGAANQVRKTVQTRPGIPVRSPGVTSDGLGYTQGPESLARPIIARPMKKGGTVKKGK